MKELTWNSFSYSLHLFSGVTCETNWLSGYPCGVLRNPVFLPYKVVLVLMILYIYHIIFITICLICSLICLLILIAKKWIYHQKSSYKNNINQARQLPLVKKKKKKKEMIWLPIYKTYPMHHVKYSQREEEAVHVGDRV